MALIDLTFVPLLEAIADKLPTVERYVVLTDAAHMPATKLKNAVAYEDWIAEVDSDFAWKEFDERTAAGLCYTSGTTGHPKGVLYSHRSNVLHSMMATGPETLTLDRLRLGPADRADVSRQFLGPCARLPHPRGANGDAGGEARRRLGLRPSRDRKGDDVGRRPDGLARAAAIPAQGAEALSTLKLVVIGGSACPPEIIRAFEEDYGVEVRHAWGMTEMSPLGTVGSFKPSQMALSHKEKLALQCKQGWSPFGVEMKIVDDENNDLPWDGKRFGRLKVKGFAVVESYFKDEGGKILDDNGFFDTGDVATIDPDGVMQITDRAKDVIKSGGEWISTIDIENLAVGHPDVAEAAVIGVAHPKWDERPLLVVVAKEGHAPKTEEVLDYLKPRIAKWWMPDDMQVVKEIPHTATGKINKLRLRETFKGYKLPTT